MAIRKMYRCLDLASGIISVTDYVYTGYVALNEIDIEYDDKLREEHCEMIAKAIDKRVEQMNAEMFLLKEKKKQFLALGNKPLEGELVDD